MSFAKFVALLAAAVSVQGITTEQKIQEMEILMSDVNSHLSDYVGLGGKVAIPNVLFNMYAEMATATDDSYTTIFAALDMSVISSMMTNLPWYSSRLLPLVSTFTDAAAIEISATAEATKVETTKAAAEAT